MCDYKDDDIDCEDCKTVGNWNITRMYVVVILKVGRSNIVCFDYQMYEFTRF